MSLTKYDYYCILDAVDTALDNSLFDNEEPWQLISDKLREEHALNSAEKAMLKTWLMEEAMGDRFAVADRLRFKRLSEQLEP